MQRIFIYIFIYLFICQFIYLFYFSICIYLSIYLFIYLLHSPHCVVGFLFLLRHLPLLLLLLLLPPPPPTTTTTTTTTTTQCGKQRRLNHFQHLRLDLCGRCGTFRTFIYLRKLRDELGRIGAAAFDGDSQV